jgi:hypothetical protein
MRGRSIRAMWAAGALASSSGSAIAGDGADTPAAAGGEDVVVQDEPDPPPARPPPPLNNQLSVDLAAEFGVLSTTHTTLTAAYARRLWDGRLYIEARLGVGTDLELAVLEERVGVGLVFQPGTRTELLVGWRIGGTHLRGHLNLAPYAVHLLAIELVVQLCIDLRSRWRLLASPVVPTLFWHRTYGGAIGLELGMGRAF